MGVVDILRTKGVAKVRNMIINLTFTPSHTHTAVQILKSGGYGNQKKKHSIKFILISQAHILRQTKLFIKLKRKNKGGFIMDGFYKTRITTVDEPYLKPISDEGIGFYNMDINTAVLTFQVRREINGESYP